MKQLDFDSFSLLFLTVKLQNKYTPKSLLPHEQWKAIFQHLNERKYRNSDLVKLINSYNLLAQSDKLGHFALKC